ncbi:MAG TPA: flagellar basal body rod C-terminal domain-containing protein, partial [Myxococcota bacterium]|nr:flagellar basal body rod C-terminal domain-containing protein [Myxococcota bacterium]
NLYSIGEGNAAQADTKSTVAQGFIERSNVNAVVEMTRLIEVNRTYTQIATMLQMRWSVASLWVTRSS